MCLIEQLIEISDKAGTHGATFDQLAEEVMELHLSLRGKHHHTPAVEWLEIASIAIGALRQIGSDEVEAAVKCWVEKHAQGER